MLFFGLNQADISSRQIQFITVEIINSQKQMLFDQIQTQSALHSWRCPNPGLLSGGVIVPENLLGVFNTRQTSLRSSLKKVRAAAQRRCQTFRVKSRKADMLAVLIHAESDQDVRGCEGRHAHVFAAEDGGQDERNTRHLTATSCLPTQT